MIRDLEYIKEDEEDQEGENRNDDANILKTNQGEEEDTPELPEKVTPKGSSSAELPAFPEEEDQEGENRNDEAAIMKAGEEFAPEVKEPEPDPLDDEENLSDMDKYFKAIGFDEEKLVEKPVSTEQRQAALKRQTNMQALGEAFKLLTEGVGAGMGSYTDKRKPNPYMDAYYKKIQDLKDKDTLNARRIEASRIRSEMYKLGLKSSYYNNAERRDHTAQLSKDRIASAAAIRKDDQAYKTKERIAAEKARLVLEGVKISNNPQTNEQFLEWKAKLEIATKKAISEAGRKDDILKVKARYKEMLNYQEQLNEKGLGGKNTTINGKVYTDDELHTEAYAILGRFPQTIDDEGYFELPEAIQKMLESKSLTKAQARMLITNYSEANTGGTVFPEEKVEPATSAW